MWRVEAALRTGFVFVLLVLSSLSLVAMTPVGVGIAGVVVAILVPYGVLQIVVIPKLRYRHFRYQVDEHELDIKQGVFVVRRRLIPLVRVQHVDTLQGPLAKQFGLASVTVSTAAGGQYIPGLSDQAADELRDRISALARVARESL
jgi:membrane protein YdbS with pleckstrin-like domain